MRSQVVGRRQLAATSSHTLQRFAEASCLGRERRLVLRQRFYLVLQFVQAIVRLFVAHDPRTIVDVGEGIDKATFRELTQRYYVGCTRADIHWDHQSGGDQYPRTDERHL